MKNQKNIEKKAQAGEVKSIAPVVGGIFGALLGAAVGTLAVQTLGNKRTRQKVSELLDKTLDVLKEINAEPHGVEKVVGNAVEEAVDVAEQKLLKTKNK